MPDLKLPVGYGIKPTSTTRQIRLAYDDTHYVDFEVDASGNINITPPTGKTVSVTTFAASGKASLSGQVRHGDVVRVESILAPDVSGLTGKGIEAYYDGTGDSGVIQAYDRTAAAFKTLVLNALLLDLASAVAGSRTKVNRVNSLEASLDSGVHGVAKTFVTLPAAAGTYIVTAALQNASASNSAYAVVVVGTGGGSTQTLNASLTGGDLTMSLSGLNVQVTLGASDHVLVNVSATRIL
jgi:hypothetical protein